MIILVRVPAAVPGAPVLDAGGGSAAQAPIIAYDGRRRTKDKGCLASAVMEIAKGGSTVCGGMSSYMLYMCAGVARTHTQHIGFLPATNCRATID